MFSAYCPDKDEIVAIKFSDAPASLIYEYHALSAMAPLPMVPRAIELDEWQDCTFMVIEYINGYNLSRYIGRCRCGYAEIAGLAWAIAFLMQRVWEQGYCLPDIKPENIIIDVVEGRIVVIDWGSVVERDRPIREFTPAYDMSSWKAGQRLGTQHYMIFSICMLMVTLIRGKPYNPLDASIIDVVNYIKRVDCQEDLKNVIIAGLQGRYISLAQFVHGISSIAFMPRNCDFSAADRIINISLIAAAAFAILAIVNWFALI